MRTKLLPGAVLITVLVLASCDTSQGPSTGALRVITNTTGGDLDIDGYVAKVDQVSYNVSVNGTAIVPNLATGSHDLVLEGVAANCQPSNASQRGSVKSGDTTNVTFNVACVATGIRVTVATGGLDLDPNGYELFVDDVSVGTVGINAFRQVTRLVGGAHVVRLGGLEPNCVVSGDNPRSVTLTQGSVVSIVINVSCGASTGVIEVSVATTGEDFDPNGYKVALDGSAPVALAVNGMVRFDAISGGSHSITLSDVSSNCTLSGDNPRAVTVAIGGTVRDTARTSLAVSCVTTRGSIHIVAATTGSELDPDGYSFVVDEDCYYYYYSNYCSDAGHGALAVNGEMTVSSLQAGQHSVRIDGIRRNCILAGDNPRSVTVTAASTTEVKLDISCVQSGNIAVTAATGGVDVDPDGYVITLAGPIAETKSVTANGNVTFDTLIPGDYQLSLSGAVVNCTVSGANPRSITVASGAATPVAFDVTCTLAHQLAFVGTGDGNAEIYLMKINGTGLTRLTTNTASDVEPAWSPDGSKIAFTSYRDAGNAEIYVMNADGSNQTRLTNDPAVDNQPTWSADGSKIVFSSNRGGQVDLYTMNPDGSNPAPLTATPDVAENDAAWSSNGTIAFTRKAGSSDVWLMNGDGSNARALTVTGSNGQPAWSPDGTRLVYRHSLGCTSECTDFLSVINADGSGNTAITPEVDQPANGPTWSPDGQWIAFGAEVCTTDYYYSLSCSNVGLDAVHPDGTGRARIFYGVALDPVWRPGGN